MKARHFVFAAIIALAVAVGFESGPASGAGVAAAACLLVAFVLTFVDN